MLQTVLAQPAAGGASLNVRGAWAANTAYVVGDVVTQAGSSYVAKAAFTSGSTFDASKWTLLAAAGAKGDPGVANGGVTGGALTIDSSGVLSSVVQPAMAFSPAAQFSTTSNSLGSACLIGDGKAIGTITLTIPAGSDGNLFFTVGFRVRTVNSTAFTATKPFISLKDPAGTVLAYQFKNNGVVIINNGTTDPGYAVRDGAWHTLGIGGSTYNGQQYNKVSFDGGSANQFAANVTPAMAAGQYTITIDTTQMAVGDLLDELVIRSGEGSVSITAEQAVDASQYGLFHFNGDTLNAVGTATTKRLSPPLADGVTVLIDPSLGLTAPNVGPYRQFFTPASDGSSLASAVNAAIQDTINLKNGRGGGQLLINPGVIDADVSISNPGIAIVGQGVRNPNSFSDPGKGVLVKARLNSTTACLSAIGSKPNPSTADGFVFYPKFFNIACSGAQQGSTATRSGGPARLVKMINCYGFELGGISAMNDFLRGFYFENCWDSYWDLLRANGLGFSDPTQTSDNATVQAYTGRSFTELETAIGRSLGCPAMEYYSPNTNGGGQDTCNNIRGSRFHFEGNAENGTPILIRGDNWNRLSFTEGKIECNDGNVPMIAASGVGTGLKIESWIYSGGSGYAYADFGGISGSSGNNIWQKYTNPGLILIGPAISPEIRMTVGYQSGHAPLQAFARFIRTENPIVMGSGCDGLGMLTPTGAAGMIFDNCGPVSKARTQLYPWAYVLANQGANGQWTERRYINGSTEVA